MSEPGGASIFHVMSTLVEIETAASRLPPAEQEALIARLSAGLRRRTGGARTRVRLPLIECGPPGSLPITDELIARLEIEGEVERHAASL